MKNLCLTCPPESQYPGCRRVCTFGVRYQMYLAEQREKVRAEKKKQADADGFMVNCITRGRGGLET